MFPVELRALSAMQRSVNPATLNRGHSFGSGLSSTLGVRRVHDAVGVCLCVSDIEADKGGHRKL